MIIVLSVLMIKIGLDRVPSCNHVLPAPPSGSR